LSFQLPGLEFFPSELLTANGRAENVDLLERVKRTEPEIVKIRRGIHQHPELAYEFGKPKGTG